MLVLCQVSELGFAGSVWTIALVVMLMFPTLTNGLGCSGVLSGGEANWVGAGGV